MSIEQNDSNPEPIDNFNANDDNGGSGNDGGGHMQRITGMYKDWFLDYASYVILERAVPHINDGFKPVQRRILHSMRRLEDGRYNKVANVIGHTMQFHPHGDASIGDALVQLGQKNLLIDMQGNWGNQATGDGAAAPRYIEARLSKFALDVVFNPKTTEWKLSYDGRNKEPITLPVKFPLLLAQGVEGIAVGLASKILPHNFNELIDASINHLKNKPFELLPDFYTGGMVEVSKYNDGLKGGNVRVRAKIFKEDNKTLKILDLPFGKTTTTLIDSILKANEKGKIKVKKIDDNTADKVEIIVHLGTGSSPDKTIDALYAFTDCEISISPNACTIEHDKPHFVGVSQILKHNTNQTLELLRKELQIRKAELQEEWHIASLEKIFILNEIYENIKTCKSEEEILSTINEGLKPFTKDFFREITRDDCVRLSNIPIKRISKYSSFKADEHLRKINEELEVVQGHLDNIVNYTIDWFRQIKKKYGKNHPRRTEIKSFDTIEATRVVVANEKLYMNSDEGFIGTGLRKETFVCECSDIDDIITIKKDGSFKITKVSNKTFVGKDIIHAAVFNKNDNRTIYNLVYRDGMKGAIYMKRCPITGLTRDKDYTLTKGTQGSQVLYFSANPNGEAEVLKIYFKPKPRLRNLIQELDFAQLAIKGKGAQGNIFTKNAIHKIVLKEKGASTLGGKKIHYDATVNRLNEDGYGILLGEFSGDDRILILTKSGNYRTCHYDVSTHLEEDILRIEKYNINKVYTVAFYDADQEYYYLKRFIPEDTERLSSFTGENDASRLSVISDKKYPQIVIEHGGKHSDREDETIDCEEFIAVKGFKARGKRLSTYTIKSIREIEPLQKEPEEEPKNDNSENNNTSPDFDDEDSGEQMTLDL